MNILFVVHDCLTMPLGIGYLGAVAKSAGHSVRIGTLLYDDIPSLAAEIDADLVGFTATTGYHNRYLSVAERVKRKRPEIITVMGGAHPTFFPEDIEQHPYLDAVCRGEGEEAFVEFADALSDGRNHTSVENFWVRDGNTIHRNPLRPRISNLDDIPFPDRSLWHPYERYMHFKTPFVMAARGCPYRCSYCFNHAYNELYAFDDCLIRRRSVENVLAELRHLKQNYPVELVVFQDDIFILDRPWILEFCDRYEREIGIPFHCHLRANLVDEEIVVSLASAGCISIKMAIESADDHIRNAILKRGMSRKQILNATRLVREAGIVLVTQNILGSPGETFEQALETLKLNVECRPGYAFATLLQPYPRTEIGEYARSRGLLSCGNDQFDHGSFFDTTILKIPRRKHMERLRMLFPLAIEFSLIRIMLPLLVRLPLNPIYGLLDKLWKGYAVKHREMRYSLSLREYIRSLRTYFSTGYY